MATRWFSEAKPWDYSWKIPKPSPNIKLTRVASRLYTGYGLNDPRTLLVLANLQQVKHIFEDDVKLGLEVISYDKPVRKNEEYSYLYTVLFDEVVDTAEELKLGTKNLYKEMAGYDSLKDMLNYLDKLHFRVHKIKKSESKIEYRRAAVEGLENFLKDCLENNIYYVDVK